MLGTSSGRRREAKTPTMSSSKPSTTLVNASLIFVQVIFGLGSVIGALGLPECNPFAFALYREICAGLILLGTVVVLRQQGNKQTHQAPSSVLQPIRKNTGRFLLLGLTIYGNQSCFIVGIKLAGGVAAAIWQPSQPIMTAAISMFLLKREPINFWRVTGVAVAFVGCATMVLLSKETESTGHPAAFLVGNFLFFVNCLSTALFVILSKQALKLYSPLVVAAWSYNLAAAYMALTAIAVSLSPAVMDFLCPGCLIWSIPSGGWFALAYFIIFSSVASYSILTWANQHASGTLVMGFTVLQPVTAAIFTLFLLGIRVVRSCESLQRVEHSACLDQPGLGSVIGMVGVFAGLFLIIKTEPKASKGGEYELASQLAADEVG